MKKAWVTGVTGRGGSRLAGFVLVKGREVHGNERRASLLNTTRADHLYQNPHLQNNHSHFLCGDLSGTSMGREMVVQRLDTARRHEPLAPVVTKLPFHWSER